VEATHCAIAIQEALHLRNKTAPQDQRVQIRIGLHIGDVVYTDQDVYGDGVNIAARMEPLAKPGGICVSEDVARQVRNKVAYPIVKLGKEKLKNISMPMDVIVCSFHGLHRPKSKKQNFLSKKRSFIACFYWVFLYLLDPTFLQKISKVKNPLIPD